MKPASPPQPVSPPARFSQPASRAAALFALALLVPALALPAAAGDWPNWRGPKATGASGEDDLPVNWGPGTNVAWKLPLPDVSGSTPIVSGERIFLHVAEEGKLSLWAVDRATGEVAWKRHLSDGDEKKRKGNLSSPSPVTDGERVWVVTGTGVVKAFDFAGKELWSRDLVRDYGAIGVLHGYASSPLLYRDTLYVQVLHGFHTDDPSYLLGLDAASGETRFRVERPSDAVQEAPDAYTTPALVTHDGKAEIVVTGADYVTGHDPATGEELWRAAGLNPDKIPYYRVVASPVVVGEMVIAPTRVKPMLALRAGGRGDVTRSHLAWSFDHGPDVPTPATDGRYLYVVDDRGVAWCLKPETGEVVWGGERLRRGTYSASPLVADGKVYATSEEGVTTVLAAGPEFRVMAENDLGEHTLASIAVAGGRLFLRTAEHLWALGGAERQGEKLPGGGDEEGAVGGDR